MLLSLCLAVLVWGAPAAKEVSAQPDRFNEGFYLRLGGGLSDYAGDRGQGGLGAFFGTDKFTRGDGLPWTLTGEVGYQVGPHFALGVASQVGRYPLVLGNVPGTDPRRITAQLLGRYAFGPERWRARPYLDAGANVTFNGPEVGAGPSIGGGLSVPVGGRWAVYFESRFNLTFGDETTDQAHGEAPYDVLNALPSAGVRYSLGGGHPGRGPSPPRVIALDGPTATQVEKPVTFTAPTGEEATGPVTYRWAFGDGTSASGRTVTHSYKESGTYKVTFTASNEAGQATDSLTVAVEPDQSVPVRITSFSAIPNPVEVGALVRFGSAVQTPSPLTYEWHFGDGTSMEGLSPRHVYDSPGRYEARLEVSGEAGKDARTISIHVTPDTDALPSKGQWGIVVASMRRPEGAEKVARRYRARFDPEGLSVEIRTAELEQGLRRRVVVGRFESADEARRALANYAAKLPPEAWLLRLQCAIMGLSAGQHYRSESVESHSPMLPRSLLSIPRPDRSALIFRKSRETS